MPRTGKLRRDQVRIVPRGVGVLEFVRSGFRAVQNLEFVLDNVASLCCQAPGQGRAKAKGCVLLGLLSNSELKPSRKSDHVRVHQNMTSPNAARTSCPTTTHRLAKGQYVPPPTRPPGKISKPTSSRNPLRVGLSVELRTPRRSCLSSSARRYARRLTAGQTRQLLWKHAILRNYAKLTPN